MYNTQVARKLAMVEADLERAEERAELGEKYVKEFESERINKCLCLIPSTMC